MRQVGHAGHAGQGGASPIWGASIGPRTWSMIDFFSRALEGESSQDPCRT